MKILGRVLVVAGLLWTVAAAILKEQKLLSETWITVLGVIVTFIGAIIEWIQKDSDAQKQLNENLKNSAALLGEFERLANPIRELKAIIYLKCPLTQFKVKDYEDGVKYDKQSLVIRNKTDQGMWTLHDTSGVVPILYDLPSRGLIFIDIFRKDIPEAVLRLTCHKPSGEPFLIASDESDSVYVGFNAELKIIGQETRFHSMLDFLEARVHIALALFATGPYKNETPDFGVSYIKIMGVRNQCIEAFDLVRDEDNHYEGILKEARF